MRYLLLFVLTITSVASAESAEHMLSSCRWVETAHFRGEDVAVPRDFESGMCWGAFDVVQTVIGVVADPAKGPIFGVCAPSESTRTQLIAIFVEYVKRNPKTMSDDFFFAARKALREVFPCKK